MGKRRFSSDDIKFINDSEFIIRKNKLVKQLFNHLNETRDELAEKVSKNPIHNFKFQPGKISKGENYYGLPYLVLDYPSHFKKENIFTFRTIIWWGNYYTINLLLKGKYLSAFKGNILLNLKKLDKDYFYLGKNPWQHQIDQSYIPIKKLNESEVQEQIQKSKFIKISQYYPLKKLNGLKENTLDFFSRLRKHIID